MSVDNEIAKHFLLGNFTWVEIQLRLLTIKKQSLEMRLSD